MIEGWSVVGLALGYVSILFALAWYADRAGRFTRTGDGRPLIYALSLAVYCTSWTFFGCVGQAGPWRNDGAGSAARHLQQQRPRVNGSPEAFSSSPWKGFEPPTYGSGGRRSNPLSYQGMSAATIIAGTTPRVKASRRGAPAV